MTLNERQARLTGKANDRAGIRRSGEPGPMSMAPSQLGIFMRSDERFETLNIEFTCSRRRWKNSVSRRAFPAITVSVCNLRPQSRGHVRIASADLQKHPDIAPNYLSTDDDRAVAADLIRIARRLMATKRSRANSSRENPPGGRRFPNRRNWPRRRATSPPPSSIRSDGENGRPCAWPWSAST